MTLKELFTKVKQFKTERDYKLKFWYLEIYNENIHDLLSIKVIVKNIKDTKESISETQKSRLVEAAKMYYLSQISEIIQRNKNIN